jgi:periplasmic divalent cation tolerance protein
MDDEAEVYLLFTTFPDEGVARQIGTEMVERQLAACVGIAAGVRSVYRWEGEVREEGEVGATFKVSGARLGELMAELGARHPYEEPELVAVRVAAGSAGYLGWVVESCGR